MDDNWISPMTGPFYQRNQGSNGFARAADYLWYGGVTFDISRVVPTTNEIRPINTAVRYHIRAVG